ncbi:hypothetical protein [Phycicoccus sp. Soil802]|uniref:hypothetical protein n=1 Tax=Phycicoccus sp. Soil802 TaxID=1736414 RepID=UPI0007032E1D|nr:hypothetical protein [Phycicoccus sp. Soil802]KRF29197.1 hypothetical protein ASG91_06330 [Phycicoccus sp. Soil802]
MRAVGDPGVDKVDWPPELSIFKTADTTHYVVATATSARSCATCSGPFDSSDRRSLTVEVRVPDPPPPEAGFRYRQFSAEVHHRSCQPPRLQVVTAPVDATTADPYTGESDMHYALLPPSGTDGDDLPGLVFTTSDPIVHRELEQAEGRSAWISTYLELGFELFAIDELGWITAHAPITATVQGALDGALFSLTGTVDGREVSLLEWTRSGDHPAYRRWRRAVTAAGALFVLYGEYVHVDADSGAVDLAPGGRLGDIVAAVVRVDVVPRSGAADRPCGSGWSP